MSQRRCIHDENGNVDAAKAAEPPVPRGSVPSKKRANGEDGSPIPVKKLKQQESTQSPTPVQPRPVEMQQHGTPFGQLKPHTITYKPPQQQQQRPAEARTEQPPHHTQQPQESQQHQQGQIDPNLFSLYTQEDHDGPYYPCPGTDQQQPYHQRPQSSGYIIPSLEQIANEVLVDMSGPEPQDHGQTALERNLHLFQNADTAPMVNGDASKPDESVDSAISIPATEASIPNGVTNGVTNGHATGAVNGEVAAQPSIEPAEAKIPTTQQPDGRPQSSASRSGAESLPLYQPPAPVSQSPEVTKGQPVLTNGHGSPPVATAETNGVKRKRDSTSATPSAKKAKLHLQGGPEQVIAEEGEVDRESLDLARMLAQEERGLRRRS